MATKRPTTRAGGSAASGRAGETVTALLTGPLAEAGFDLEDVALRRAGARHTLAVAVDRDGGVDLDAVAAASTVVSAALDAHDRELPEQLRGTYDLEVSSRGTSSPLTLPRHWRRSVSRLVEVRRTDGTTVTGRITAADDAGADLDAGSEAVRVDYAEVRTARVQLEFRRPPGLDPADDEEEETP